MAIQILDDVSDEQVTLVRKRHVDVPFVIGTTAETRDCDLARLLSERLFIVLPQGHPLAIKRDLGALGLGVSLTG